MNTITPKQDNQSSDKLISNIPTWAIYILIFSAIVFSLLFYFFPYPTEYTIDDEVAKVYVADNITKAHTEIVEAFNKKYLGKIEVIPVDIPTIKFTTNKRKELITRTLRSRNSRIDLFAVDQIWVPRFTKWAEPLDKYFQKEELKNILPQALKTCYFDNSLFAIPFFIDVGILYYRTDLINNLPNSDGIVEKINNGISWNELIEINHKYFSNKPAYVFQGDAYEGLICNFIEALGKDFESFYARDQFNINTPAIRDKTKLFIDLIHKHKLSPNDVTTFDEGKSFDYALNNDIPFFRGWPTTVKYSNLVSKTTEKLNLLREAQLPKHDNDLSASTIGGWNFILSRYSNVKEEAVTFIKFVLSQKIQELNYTSGSYLPILNSFYQQEEFLIKYPKFSTFTKIINNGIHRPSLTNYTKLSDILSLYINKALKREITVEQALESAQYEIDFILSSSKN